MVVVCTPVNQVADDLIEAAAHTPDDALITDAGSTKARIVSAVEGDPRACARFVGGHPLAGSERHGVAFARAGLFEGRVCVLTPTPRTPADRLKRAHAFWNRLGCRVLELDPAAHDDALAWTSHLPHAVAAALAASVPAEALPLAAGAYRDGTRVAAADTNLWAAIFLENRSPLLRALDGFASQLDELRRIMQEGDETALHAWWDAGRACRRQFERLNNPTEIMD